MLKIDQLKVPLDYDAAVLKERVVKILGGGDVREIRLLKKALDARKKEDLHYVLNVVAEILGDENVVLKRCKKKNVALYLPKPYILPRGEYRGKNRPVVVGAGPAGLFAALLLAEKGAKPLILEGGKKVEERQRDVSAFFEGGDFDPTSNIQFGEGGAGAFSDGKLTTGTKDFRHGYILDTFLRCGAPPEIFYAAKPHIGSDYLPTVVMNLRRRIEALGGSFRFQTAFTDFQQENGRIKSITLRGIAGEETLAADVLILATGHSSRKTYRLLHEKGVAMTPKAFSLGVRIEHLQSQINASQYGTDALGAADYKLAVHLPNGRSAYTFCMCPGGVVVAAASVENTVVTNGMSAFSRDQVNANSALLVGVTPEDFPEKGTLGGMLWQEEIEKQAFLAGGGGYAAVCQRVGDFLAGRPSVGCGAVVPTYLPKVTYGSIESVLPPLVTAGLKEALPLLAQRLKGFAAADALLTAAETRSSAPLRILRDDGGEANVKGVFPCGEGAGYAGGIMSSAADGLRIGERLFI